MQVAGQLRGQKRQVQLNERLGSTLTAHTGVGPSCIQADLRGTGEDHPVHRLLVGDGQRLRHRGCAIEALRGSVERLVLIAEDRYRPVPSVDREHGGVRGKDLDAVAQALHELAAPQSEQRSGPFSRRPPVGPGRNSGPQFLRGQQAHISQSRHWRGQLREVGQQKPGGRVVTRLAERNFGQPLGLRHLHVMLHHRLVARRSAKRHPATLGGGVGGDQQHRAGAAPAALRPCPAHIRGRRPTSCHSEEYFQPAGSVLSEQACRYQRRRESVRRRPSDGLPLSQEVFHRPFRID